MPSAIIPSTYDPELLADIAGLVSPLYPWGVEEENGVTVLYFPVSRYEETMQAIEDYESVALSRKKEELCNAVDALRDTLIEGGFEHDGHRFQSRQSDRENIIGASVAAMGAIMNGAQPGDLRWSDPNSDFVWIAEDNTLVPLDASGMMALYKRGFTFKAGNTFYARALKDAILAAETMEAVLAIDIESGWPA